MSSPESIVAQTDLDEELRVSTVFLGIDHNWARDPDDPAVLFETLVFGEERTYQWRGKTRAYRESLAQRRYRTWAEAEEGHKEMCEEMRKRFEESRAVLPTPTAPKPEG
jgi:hypothetical protein